MRATPKPPAEKSRRCFCLGTFGLDRLKSYRQASVAARLAVGSAALGLIVLAAALLSLSLGPVEIPVSHVAAIIFSPLGLDLAEFGRTEELVIQQIRLPRIVVGACVGMALGVAGATMQGLFRNPMADPGIIGVSRRWRCGCSGGYSHWCGRSLLPGTARVRLRGALLPPAFWSTALPPSEGASPWPRSSWQGVAVNAFLGAVVTTIIILLPDNAALREILFWLAGGLDSRTWEHVQVSAPFILGGIGVILLMTRDLNLLMLGDDEARSMGVRVGPARIILLAAAAMATGAAVAVSGTIAFVGLVTPHVLRLLLGPDHRVLVPMSAAGGAIFVLLADTVGRTIIQPAEFRVGVLAAFVGAPFFIFLLIKNKQRAYSL